MNITGPLPPGPVQRPEEQAIDLRMNQRINAEVIQIGSDKVVLEIQGVRVVARLTEPGQAAQLIERRNAQFVVRDANPQNLTLQLLPAAAAPLPQAAGPAVLAQDLASRLLLQAGLPADQNNLTLARALIGQGIVVTPELMEDMKNILSTMGSWGAPEAQVAANLKANGILLTPGTISLAMTASTDFSSNLVGLATQLKTWLAQGKADPQLASLGREAVALLEQGMVRWDTSPTSSLAENIQKAIHIFGRSVESHLAQWVQKGDKPAEGERGLLVLTDLRQALSKAGQEGMVKDIDHFLENTRLSHLLNSEPQSVTGRGQWANLELPLRLPITHPGNLPNQLPEWRPSRLRVAYRSEGGEKGRIDPNYTRLIIQIDLDPAGKQSLQVDLSVVGRQIAAQVMTSNSDLVNTAVDEMPALQKGLAELGFTLQTSRVDVGETHTTLPVPSPNSPLGLIRAIDLNI